MFSSRSRACSLTAALFLLFMGHAQATPFTITSQLTGDPRAENPDGIVVNVRINADSQSNKALWRIDLDSATLHPGMKLHELYFNVLGSAGDYIFNNFSPSAWSAQLNDVVKGAGSGGSTFIFEVIDPPGGAKADVNNNVTLSFEMTKLLGNFSPEDFTQAPSTTTSAGFTSQIGAHLQNLSKIGALNTSDSGFATGNFIHVPPTPPVMVSTVTEPGLPLLLASGLAAMILIRRRASRADYKRME